MRAGYASFVVFLTVPLMLIQPPCCSADREVKEVEKKSFRLEPGGTVKIAADEGYVRLTTWERPEVSVTMTKYGRGRSKREAQRRLDEIDVRLEQRGNRLTIRERGPGDRSFSLFDLFDPDTWSELSGRSAWVDFDLSVPEETDCIIFTDEGDVSVSQIEGEMDVKTDEGEIELRRIRSERLSVTTDEGNILLEHIEPQEPFPSGRLVIDTDEGDVELFDVEVERVEIETDEGDVVADMLRCRRLDFYSDEGTIEADMDILSGGDYRCRTDEGEVILVLPRDASFAVTARSQEGEVRSDFPLEVREVGDGHRVDETVGGGDADLYIYVDEGDIRLREK